jgi:hypothetical protein
MAAEETLNAFFDELLTRCAPAARAPAPPPEHSRCRRRRCCRRRRAHMSPHAPRAHIPLVWVTCLSSSCRSLDALQRGGAARGVRQRPGGCPHDSGCVGASPCSISIPRFTAARQRRCPPARLTDLILTSPAGARPRSDRA